MHYYVIISILHYCWVGDDFSPILSKLTLSSKERKVQPPPRSPSRNFVIRSNTTSSFICNLSYFWYDDLVDEEQLTTNEKHPIVRIGDKVHRPVHWWTPAVHDLLKYLESIGFIYSPRVFGFDTQGREILSHIKGESGKAGWGKIVNDEGLRKFAKLLRSYHDAVANYKPEPRLEWATGAKGLKPEEVICHGDFGPWNIVWQGDDPVGIIDWDLVHPALPEEDILYGLEYSAPFRDDETTIKWHHFPEVPDRHHRIEVFLEAYGTSPIPDIANKVANMQRTVGKREAYLAGRGVQPQVDWVANGDLEEIEIRSSWTENNSQLL